ncbi:AraC family transcriptional regulator [Candidatus Symbiopectobacterium sp. NZEC151]|uniref:helix-turn-helix domain-containing protein n=1 Tax=Candidatus Symbiopectobacterium sp. NZEC151 TaxID=2820470 RepID=UPI002225FC88|nr:AraC family transcriptional regulator [Candidatus Symbiopectobacterium sp. NZEC151]MCW2473355.1 AraC family transcriptional regulator [Candidatus Symbiopectobacterium sp. NZEC151]
MSAVHRVKQAYWFSPHLPQVECRSTWCSAQGYKTHSHTQLSLGLVVAGNTVCHYRGADHLLRAGDMVLIDPDAPHSCTPLPGQTRSYHMFYLDAAWCRAILSQQCGQPVAALHCHPVCVQDPALFGDGLQLLNSLYRHDIHSATPQLNAMVSTLLSRYCSAQQPLTEQSTTRYMRQRLLSNLQTSPSLTTLAQELHLRRETLVRHFRADTGITPMAFLNNARIEYAKTLIKQGVPLADAGYQSGFSDQSHFHKIFVLHTAATPGQYQQASGSPSAAITI